MNSRLLFIIILNITIYGSIITSAQQQQSHLKDSQLLQQSKQPKTANNSNKTDDQRQQQESMSIYGVRWFLGDYFAFHMKQNPPPNQQMFILMFNSINQLDDQIYLLIQGTRYGCYQRFLEIQSVGQHHQEHNKNASKQGQNFTNAMYKCIVYAQTFNGLKQINYQIISGWTIFQGKDNATQIRKYREYELFKGILRVPQNMDKLSFYFLADWGLITQKMAKQQGYKDVMPSLIKTLTQNPNIGMLVFGGDLAYDFQGQMYIDILKYLQPITSQIVTLGTPGNHESVYHEDSLELFVESFYTPMWYKYFNYFSVTVIDAHKLVIVSYDPQNYVFPWINRLGKNLSEIFNKQLNNTITEYIKKNYDVVAYSHYPMHCSEQGEHYQTCQENKIRFEPFMKKFTSMGIDLYLSGHLHIYQRTKPICGDESDYRFNEENIYNKSCPVFVVEGDAGNSMWVEMKKRYQPMAFSGKIVFETGYGVVSFDHRNITYEHYQVHDKTNATLQDKVTLYQPVTQQSKQGQDRNNRQQQSKIQRAQQKIVIGLQVIALVVVAGIAVCLLYQLKIKRRTGENEQKKNSHVQMIQQNFETPSNNNKNQTIQQPSLE